MLIAHQVAFDQVHQVHQVRKKPCQNQTVLSLGHYVADGLGLALGLRVVHLISTAELVPVRKNAGVFAGYKAQLLQVIVSCKRRIVRR